MFRYARDHCYVSYAALDATAVVVRCRGKEPGVNSASIADIKLGWFASTLM